MKRFLSAAAALIDGPILLLAGPTSSASAAEFTEPDGITSASIFYCYDSTSTEYTLDCYPTRATDEASNPLVWSGPRANIPGRQQSNPTESYV